MLFYKFLLKYGLGFATLLFIAILEFKVWVYSLIFLGACPNPLEKYGRGKVAPKLRGGVDI